MATFVSSIFWVLFLTATAVATYHGLNEVAKELEVRPFRIYFPRLIPLSPFQMPFGTDPNDLPIAEYQLLLNDRLQQLLFMGERQFQVPPFPPSPHAPIRPNICERLTKATKHIISLGFTNRKLQQSSSTQLWGTVWPKGNQPSKGKCIQRPFKAF